MRITGGTHGGRVLGSPKDRAIRPTSDKVRLALFNMLESRGLVVDAIVLDAFCGTGALGIEALSRGADSAIFFDKNRAALDLARANHAVLKMKSPRFLLKDASKPGIAPPDIPPATLVFLDPPYHEGLIALALDSLGKNGWIAPEAHLVLESEKGFDPANLPCTILLSRDYGDTQIILAQYPAGG
jgi:16S rRNA (guanine966-N2)-methyltransferase